MDPLLRIDGNPTYQSWKAIRRRCGDKTDMNYGGRGISICPSWGDYDVFVADMGPRPEGTTIDRINSNLDYYPENCRWQTPRQQANNRSTTRSIEFQGETMSVTQWSRRVGLSDQTLFYRLNAGWPVEKALTTKSERKKQWVPSHRT